MSITLNGITKRFGGKTVLDDLTATLPGGVICLSGASGCGKTTLAMIIAGLLKPDSGNIGGISGNVTVMFQEPRLFPAFSALENVACAAKGGSGEAEAEKLMSEASERADAVRLKSAVDARVLLSNVRTSLGDLTEKQLSALKTVSKDTVSEYEKLYKELEERFDAMGKLTL